MRRVYLIRHGLPDFPDGEKMCIGRTDIPLGAEGLDQARQMAQRLPAVSAVFSSPLRRAVQTAEAIGMSVSVLPDLRELDAGAWDGLTFSQIRQRYPQLYAARQHDRTLPLPDAEDDRDGLKRFCGAMLLAADAAAGDFAVVAHGGVISLFLEHIGGTRRKPAYAEVVPLCFDNDMFTIEEVR